jgi:hypothetical protein
MKYKKYSQRNNTIKSGGDLIVKLSDKGMHYEGSIQNWKIVRLRNIHKQLQIIRTVTLHEGIKNTT